MKLEPGALVRHNLSAKFTDLRFSVAPAGGGPAFVHILVEPQSTSDREMPLRMLSFMVAS